MHLQLEDFQELLSERRSGRREELADHVLECAVCARRFQALHGLQEKQQARGRMPLTRYAIAAAAVVGMATFPYLRDGEVAEPVPSAEQMVARAEASVEARLGVLDQVREINQRDRMTRWGKDATVLELLREDG